MSTMIRSLFTCSNFERDSNETEFLKFENLPDVREQLTEGPRDNIFPGYERDIISSVKLTEFVSDWEFEI
jgi:hypothetical protein